jgi:hypothetical protein
MGIFSGEAGKEIALALNDAFHAFSEEGEWERFKKSCSALDEDSIRLVTLALENKPLEKSDVEKYLKSNENKTKLALAIVNLYRELEKTKSKGLIKLFMYLVSDSDVAEYLNDTCLGFWEEPLVKNKLLTSEDLKMIWNVASHRYEQAWGTPVRDIAKHKNCPASLLRTLYDFDDEEPLRKNIAQNQNIDEELCLKFTNSRRKKERIAIAKSKFIPLELLELLSKDKDSDVKFFANKNLSKQKK